MFRFDNPGGEWLARKRAWAAEDHAPERRGVHAKGLGGSATAWTVAPLMIPTASVARLRGVNNEQRAPGDPQYDALAESVAESGWDDEQQGNAVLIGVNHFGVAYIIEGNTRAAWAAANGVERLRAEVRWFNGAEEAPGDFCLTAGRPAFLGPEEGPSPGP